MACGIDRQRSIPQAKAADSVAGMADLQAQIEDLWERRAEVRPGDADAAALVHEAVGLLDTGRARVIVEDEAMVGSRCMVTQGARVGRGSVLAEGVILNPGIPVIDAQTGEELSRGHVPPWSVAVQATRRRAFPGGEFGLPCVLVI